MDITFDVVGLPVPQGRARIYRNTQTGRPHGVDPEESVNWKQIVKLQSLPYRPKAPSLEAVGLHVEFRLPRPKSLPKKITEHIRKPDLDNLVVAVQNALRKVFYRDDSQIIVLVAAKRYAAMPGVTIRVTERLDKC